MRCLAKQKQAYKSCIWVHEQAWDAINTKQVVAIAEETQHRQYNLPSGIIMIRDWWWKDKKMLALWRKSITRKLKGVARMNPKAKEDYKNGREN